MATEGCLAGNYAGLVTGPVHKSVISDAGLPFTGHTEFLAELCQAHPVMLQQADAVLAMYHDQGLPVLKHLGFDQAVNVTLGLPIIRTSVDHGTALPAQQGFGGNWCSKPHANDSHPLRSPAPAWSGVFDGRHHSNGYMTDSCSR